MGDFVNPALQRFLQQMGPALVVVQVQIRRLSPETFELRHVQDAMLGPESLKVLEVAELRAWAQETKEGRFRPLHASPDLRDGWRCVARTAGELELALESLYPGFLADWLAVQQGPAPVTDYYPFTQRQSGMYRLTAKASPEQAAALVRACCAPRFCLKQRLWTVPGLVPDQVAEKSIIPCLEPCAVLLEFARKRMRIAQETPVPLSLAPTEIRGLLAALDRALLAMEPSQRVADFGVPSNPRHLEHLRQKLLFTLPTSPASGAVSEEE